MPSSGVPYTWSNGRQGAKRIDMRLDRSFCNDESLSTWNTISCHTLSRMHSDHTPLLLTLQKGPNPDSSPFMFQKMWLEHSDCRKIVLKVWNQQVLGCPMFVLGRKLRLLKVAFCDWNKTCFGNIHEKVTSCYRAVDEIQQDISQFGYSAALIDKESKAQLELDQALSMQESFGRKRLVLDGIVKGTETLPTSIS